MQEVRMQWHGVEERLPDSDTEVFVRTRSGQMYLAWEDGNGWETPYGLLLSKKAVTHWADPVPPEVAA
jgi:hypothetical protein